MANYSLQINPAQIQVNFDTVATPQMRPVPVIYPNSLTSQTGKPDQNVNTAPSVKVFWPDTNEPATTDSKFIIKVTFAIKQGGGTVNGKTDYVTVEPDSQGVATLTSWKLGKTTGINSIEVTGTITSTDTSEDKVYQVSTGTDSLSNPTTFTATPEAGVLNVFVLPNPADVELGQQIALTATAQLENYAAQPTWAWTSSDPTIATVSGNSANAVVTGVKVGSVTITATATSGNSSKSGAATINVKQTVIPTISISPNNNEVTVSKGSTGTNRINISRSNYTGNVSLVTQPPLPNGVTITFIDQATTSNVSTANISVGTAATVGTYTIQVEGTGTGVQSATTSFTLTISDVVSQCTIVGVSIDPTGPVERAPGQTIKVTGTAEGTNCTSQQLAVTYESSNPSVATVNSNGTVTALLVGNSVITARSVTDASKFASVEIIVRVEEEEEEEDPTVTWRSCDGEIHQGNPPAGYVSATYTGAGNGICWEPVSIVGFEPDLATALLFRYRRGSSTLPDSVTVTARNPALAVQYRLKLETNPDIEITPSTFDLAPQGTKQFTVKVTKALLDKLADGTSDISLNIDITRI